MKADKTVYFVRHGQSEANLGNFSYGDHDSPLSTLGRDQAERIAERCKKIEIDVIIASTMRRARETAEKIATATGKPFETSELFIERRMPTSIEQSRGELGGKAFETWKDTMYVEDARFEDGENFQDIKSRAGSVLAYLEKRKEERVIVVAHGFLLRMILARLLFGESLTPEEIKQTVLHTKMDNTGITVLQYASEGQTYDGMPVKGWFLKAWNDHAHLG